MRTFGWEAVVLSRLWVVRLIPMQIIRAFLYNWMIRQCPFLPSSHISKKSNITQVGGSLHTPQRLAVWRRGIARRLWNRTERCYCTLTSEPTFIPHMPKRSENSHDGIYGSPSTPSTASG